MPEGADVPCLVAVRLDPWPRSAIIRLGGLVAGPGGVGVPGCKGGDFRHGARALTIRFRTLKRTVKTMEPARVGYGNQETARPWCCAMTF